MADMDLDRALATLNFARSTLNPTHVMIFIYGDDDGNPHMGVGVDQCVDARDVELNDFFGFHDAIAETQIAGDYVTLALEADPALRIMEDHAERWVVIRQS